MDPLKLSACVITTLIAASLAYSDDVVTQDQNPQLQLKGELQVKGEMVGKVQDDSGLNSPIVFSPDGKRCAYISSDDMFQSVVLVEDSKILKDELFSSIGMPVFSPDGRQFAYIAFRLLGGKTKGLVSIGDALGMPFDKIDAPIFVSRETQPSVTPGIPEPDRPQQSFLVIGSKDDVRSAQISWRVISPSGTDAGYRMGKSQQGPDKAFFALDKQMTSAEDQQYMKSADIAFAGQPVFSSDGLQVAFEGAKKEDHFVIVGDISGNNFRKGEAFQWVGNFVFSKEKGHLAYIAKRKNQIFVVVNNIVSQPYDAIYSQPVFTERESLVRFGARAGNEIWWELLKPD